MSTTQVIPASPPPEKDYNTGKQHNWGVGLVILGLAVEFLQVVFFSNWRVPLLMWVGMGMCGIGLAYYAKVKERSVAWCATALFPFLGPLLGLLALSRQAPLVSRPGPRDCQLANLSVVAALASWTVFGGAMFGEIKPPEGALMLIVATSLAAVLLGHLSMFRIMLSRGELKGWGLVFVALGMSYPLLLSNLPLLASLFSR